jgi:hypothetical protein
LLRCQKSYAFAVVGTVNFKGMFFTLKIY